MDEREQIDGTDGTFRRLLLASPEPVLVVEAREGERIIAANAAARALFGRDEAGMRFVPLTSLLPNIDARSIAVAFDAALEAHDFVRAWARNGETLTAVTLGAIGDRPSPNVLAVFVRSEATRLGDATEAQVSEARLKFALDAARIGDWDMDLRTNIAFRSRMHDACFGYSVAPEEWGYDTFLSHVHPDDRERVDGVFQAALGGKGAYDVEFRAVWPDGSIHWLWSKGSFYHDAAGVPIRVAGIQVDITERISIEERGRLSALAMAATTDAIVIADVREPDAPMVYVNEAFERMTGYAAHEVIGKNCRILQGNDRAQPEIAQIRAALADGVAVRVTLRNYRKDRTMYWNALTLSPVRDSTGTLTHYVGVQSDVTRNKQFEAGLLHRATHDPLTGLPNSALLEERLATALQDADRNGSLVAVAFVDIDRLKHVNDSLGHAGGDMLITSVASRLSGAVRSIDTVARFGGDEFVIVFPDLANIELAERLVSRLRGVLGMPLMFADVELAPSASVGIGVYPHDASDVPGLIRVADTAMYAAKAVERGGYRFFDRSSMKPATNRLAIEIALTKALPAGEFRLEYQPIFHAETGRIAALEALLRWHHPERGRISPLEFVPLAEESGLIVPIGEWVLRTICRQHRAWRETGVPLVPIAMNVSIAQLRRGDFATRFAAIVADAQVEPQWIVLEITESIVMDNAERFLKTLRDLRASGARISIDDFGTGFSSLSYLKRLSLDTLKIDKSFVEDITNDSNAAAICEAIVALAHSVGLTVVAEGVETAAQAEFLRDIACDELQGFYFARPADAASIEDLLRSTVWGRPARSV